jgi:hypothetical protein
MSPFLDQRLNGRSRHWMRSSACNNNGCVEVSIDGDVKIRDSKLSDSPELTYTADEWRAFVAGVKNGEFDIR